MTSVAIIVPCHNEARVIEAKVANCMALAGEDLSTEVVVADDHSTDDTAALAAAAGAKVVANCRPRGKWNAILCAAEAIDGDIICITDADVSIEAGALGRAVEMFRDAGIGAVCGMRRMVRVEADAQTRCDGLYDRARMLMVRFYSWLDSTPTIYGPMMLVRRELVDKIDGGKLRADDVDLPVQVRKLGFKAKVCPRAWFTEPQLPGPARRGQAIRRALGIAQAYWHHRSALLNPRLGLFGLVAYPMEFAFFFLSPFVVLAACAAAGIFAAMGNRVALAACGLVAVEELLSLAMRAPTGLARILKMARAELSFMFGARDVTGQWQPPREG